MSSPSPSPKRALIIGAGPAGLTAAYELLTRTDIVPTVIEMDPRYVGGISKTVEYKGNRMDIGGHRFFSKSDRVMRWWMQFLPLQAGVEAGTRIVYQGREREVFPESRDASSGSEDEVMLVRRRISRIYFHKTFFPYPITLSPELVRKLGWWRMGKIAVTYVRRLVFPRRPEKSLEDFYINRFGDELYKTFFASYTQKVWGVPCAEISAEWGAQRVKGLSILKALTHFFQALFPKRSHDLAQKRTETSLIEQFLYPKFGPGLMWEVVARKVREKGGQICLGERVVRVEADGKRVTRVCTRDAQGHERWYAADYVFSTMPIKELAQAFSPSVPMAVAEVAEGLRYRDFITVGILAKHMAPSLSQGTHLVPDNWIYIQEPDVLVGRIQVFNNWSEYMVQDPDRTVWMGLEYFCSEGDSLWNKTDEELLVLAKEELAKMGMVSTEDVLDGVVLREKKTYPAYFGTYNRFDEVRSFFDSFENLFLIGRNGMHRYNNQDHSMLTAMLVVDQLASGQICKADIWGVNTEQEYHEEK